MANANPTPKPKFQIEGGVYTYIRYHGHYIWTFKLQRTYYRFDACIPNNPMYKLKHIFAHLNINVIYKDQNHLLRCIRKCKGRKQ